MFQVWIKIMSHKNKEIFKLKVVQQYVWEKPRAGPPGPLGFTCPALPLWISQDRSGFAPVSNKPTVWWSTAKAHFSLSLMSPTCWLWPWHRWGLRSQSSFCLEYCRSLSEGSRALVRSDMCHFLSHSVGLSKSYEVGNNPFPERQCWFGRKVFWNNYRSPRNCKITREVLFPFIQFPPW